MRAVPATLILCLVTTPVAAELKYTVRIEARKVPAAEKLDPNLTALGARILAAVAPDNSVELTVIAGDNVARVTWSKAIPGIPAGVALVLRADGGRFLVDPANQVYWRAGMPDLYSLGASNRPVITHTAQNSSEIIAGLPVTLSSVTIRIPFAEALNGMMVQGTPTNMPLNGKVWVTDSFPRYATRQLRAIHGLALMGLDVAPLGKLVLRQVLQGPLFGDIELESKVMAIAEEDLPDTLFIVPTGFKEVPAPRIRR